MKLLNKCLAVILSCACILSLIPCITVTAEDTKVNWQPLNSNMGISPDPITGDIIFTTIDRKRTSNIYYRTVGFTLSDGQKNADGTISDSGLGEIWLSLDNDKLCKRERENVDLNEGYLQSSWRIYIDEIINKIKQDCPAWYEKIQDESQTCYIKIDAQIAVSDYRKKDNHKPINSHWSGYLNRTTGKVQPGEGWDTTAPYYGIYTKYNFSSLSNIFGGINQRYINDHFRKAIILHQAKEVETPNLALEPSEHHIVARIGKDTPTYKTFNYSTNGQFDLADAIPTSEDVTNGFIADEWFGSAAVAQKEDSRTYTFSGNISYPVTTKKRIKQDDGTYKDVEITSTESEAYSYKVSRSVNYYYLVTPQVYDLSKVRTTNEVFQNGMHNYTSKVAPTVQVTQNGESVVGAGKYKDTADSSYHINWAGAEANYKPLINVSGDSKSAAIATFKQTAESRITANKDIQVRNDWFVVTTSDGVRHEFMNGDWHSFSQSPEATPNAYTWSTIQESDYGVETQTNEQIPESGIIPSTVKNNKYYTGISVEYAAVVSNQGLEQRYSKDSYTSIPDRIRDGNVPNNASLTYQSQEPVKVHTPVIAPVEICIQGTDTRLDINNLPSGYEYLNTQSVRGTSAYNENSDYQLLLETSYSIKFRPKEHGEHVGYIKAQSGTTASGNYSLYNKYTKRKYVAFPFAVQVNNKIYEPTDEVIPATDDCPEKLRAYTEWIPLYSNDGDGTTEDTVDFYIVPWAKENDVDKIYQIKYMVVPENADVNDFNAYREQYEINNSPRPEGGFHTYDYMATYSMDVQVSGWIYDFQVVGITDRDRYEGYKEVNGSLQSNGSSMATQSYPFCPTYQEKKVGANNRWGKATPVRYTFDGTLATNWNRANLLPLAAGSSLVYANDGELIKRNKFAFSVRTIANLWSTQTDTVYIKPSFRWVSYDGTKTVDDVKVYYPKEYQNKDGKWVINQFTSMGSKIDLQNQKQVRLDDPMFKGAFYYEDASLNRTLWQFNNATSLVSDDLQFSWWEENKMLYDLYHPTNPNYPREVYKDKQNYMHKPGAHYTVSEITLDSDSRILSGNREQLAQNFTKQGTSMTWIKDTDANGNVVDLTSEVSEERFEKFRMSMQTWYGEYFIPGDLFVTMPDAPDVFDYVVDKGYIDLGEENTYIDKDGNKQNLFMDDGYLIVNFEIYTKNEGKDHLQYYGTNGGGKGSSKDQWKQEGSVPSATAGDKDIDEDIQIPTRSGDVAIIDTGRTMNSRWKPGKMITN